MNRGTATGLWRRHGAFSETRLSGGCDFCEYRNKQEISTANEGPQPDAGLRSFVLGLLVLKRYR